jgi:hypothetical protein
MRYLLVVALALGTVGCNRLAGPEYGQVNGVLQYHDLGPFITVPDSVAAGQDFEVGIRTLNISCAGFGETVVEQVGTTATVTPYDLVPVAVTQWNCPDSSRMGNDHSVTLRFDSAGLVRVHVQGVVHPPGSVRVFEYDVVVH